MYKLLAALAFVFVLAGCATAPGQQAHRLVFEDGSCSAVAVGPHTILSARHCFRGSTLVKIDNDPVAILDITGDKWDHVLVKLDHTFKSWKRIGDIPPVGSPIHYVGNPGLLKHMYRGGYVAGDARIGKWQCTMLNVQGFFGDSGAGVIDESGRVVGVISLIVPQTAKGAQFTMMCMIPLHFTDKQYREFGVAR